MGAMRLNVGFGTLEEAVRRMGAASVRVDLNIDVRRGIDPVDPIDIDLREGIELGDLSDIKSDPELGLLTYRGRQIVLHIQDHQWRIRQVLEDGATGNKVHVADCQTLQAMQLRGRYERYVATTDVSGDFHVTGQDAYGRHVEGKTRLKVCKNCLQMLNYRNYAKNKERVFHAFNWNEFFDTYRPHFARMPTRRAGVFDGAYAADWELVSGRYKEAHGFTCESCRVDLREHPRLLHVHHLDGVKTNNDWSNLRALCAVCHRDQPGHEHMHVSFQDADLIADLRWRQKLLR